MQNNHPKTPTQANYRILELIEQMVTVASKGTALGLTDLISAMFSGYFIESGGAVTPAIEAFLQREVKDEKEREARTRRGAKALTYGSYNVKELIDKLQEIVEGEGHWQPTIIQGYRVAPVDFTAFRRAAVKGLKAKAYVSDADKAVPAIPIGMIASVGEVNGQRIALLKNVVQTDLNVNDGLVHKKQLYQQVAKELAEDEIAVFDAGFKLVEAVEANIMHALIRLSKNVTFGKTAGKIPKRASAKGPEPSQYKAKIVRPLARSHGDKTLPATPADRISTMIDKNGCAINIHIC